MLSSKISETLAQHFLVSIIFAELLFAALVVMAVVVEEESTSTTLTTALPSNTFRTLSASHFFVVELPAPAPEEVAIEEPPPENASQNAFPNFFNKVCEATTANIAACASLSFSFSLSLLLFERLGNRGDMGGVTGPPNEVDEGVEYLRESDGEEKNAGRSPDA